MSLQSHRSPSIANAASSHLRRRGRAISLTASVRGMWISSPPRISLNAVGRHSPRLRCHPIRMRMRLLFPPTTWPHGRVRSFLIPSQGLAFIVSVLILTLIMTALPTPTKRSGRLPIRLMRILITMGLLTATNSRRGQTLLHLTRMETALKMARRLRILR